MNFNLNKNIMPTFLDQVTGTSLARPEQVERLTQPEKKPWLLWKIVSFGSDSLRAKQDSKTQLQSLWVNTEDIDNEIEQEVVNTPPAVKLTKQEFFTKLNKLKELNPELSSQEIMNNWLRLSKQKWYEIEWIDIDKELWIISNVTPKQVEQWWDLKEEATWLTWWWQFIDAVTAVPKWIVSTVKWAFWWVEDIIEWNQGLWGKLWTLNWDELRWLLWKPPLTEEQKKENPFWWDTTVSEDLLNIWQGSLTTWFVTVFPWATVMINSIWETEWWEEILKWLSTVIGKWWEVVNKLPWLKQFRESLPEEKRAEFDAFTWQIATIWAIKLGWKWLWKIKESRLRTTEEVWANILKPTARTPLDFEAWTRWLQQLNDVRPFKPKSFKELLKEIKKKQNTDFPALETWLIEAQKNIKPIKDTSVWQALDWLDQVLKWQWWKSFTKIRARINELKKKHNKTWLELIELQEIKTMHTQFNELFSDLWAVKWWFSKKWLQDIRSDIKTLIELEAEKWWFKNVKEINTKYWELVNAEQFIKLQEWSLKSYLWRQGKQSFLQDVATFVLDLPWIKQWFTAPAQAVFGKLSRSLREWKINPIEVQKQLPSLFKELKAAWVKEWTINQIKTNFNLILDWIIIIGWKQQQTKVKKDAMDILLNK